MSSFLKKVLIYYILIGGLVFVQIVKVKSSKESSTDVQFVYQAF